ncbi:MAG: hypothetical protein WDW36_000533 [Sanguina aurantia]
MQYTLKKAHPQTRLDEAIQGNNIGLTRSSWNLSADSNASFAPLQASVPGYPHSVLFAAGLVGDPLYRFNETAQRWVSESTWRYSRTFEIPACLLGSMQDPSGGNSSGNSSSSSSSQGELAYPSITLMLQGVDTVADVLLNGRLLASLGSFHRRFFIPVGSLLRTGRNTLEIVLHPIVPIAQQAHDTFPYEVPANQAIGAYPHYNFVRKPASDFGWDWGPAFAIAGVQGDVSLLAHSVGVLTGLHIQQFHSPDSNIQLVVEAEILVPSAGSKGLLQIQIPELGLQQTGIITFPTNGQSYSSVEFPITQPVELWWPVGYGGQTLYTVQATYTPLDPTTTNNHNNGNAAPTCSCLYGICSAVPGGGANGSESAGLYALDVVLKADERVVDSRDMKVGIRTITIDTSADAEEPGASFFRFVLNGVPIFARGVCWVPASSFVGAVDEPHYRHLLQMAADANMNMIRIWAGPAGLMVWHEFLFACAPYPNMPSLLKQIDLEVAQQVRRLASHPSVALWGGGNEIEASLTWPGPTLAAAQNNTALYVVDLDRLFVQRMGSQLARLDPARNYVSASPSNGVFPTNPLLDGSMGPTKRWGDPQDPSFGDVHFYNYVDDCFDPEMYPAAKFVSEFGYQSPPSFAALKNYSLPEDWAPFTPLMAQRQRHPDGDAQLLSQLSKHFPMPAAWTDSDPGAQLQLFHRWVYLTQLQQALAYTSGISRWRRLRGDASALTMGVLYWQLNDIWPGYSWSSLDYGLNWKPLHHAITRLYAPVIISALLVGNGTVLEVHVISDLHNTSVPATITLSLTPTGNATRQPSSCPPASLTPTPPPNLPPTPLPLTPSDLVMEETMVVQSLRSRHPNSRAGLHSAGSSTIRNAGDSGGGGATPGGGVSEDGGGGGGSSGGGSSGGGGGGSVCLMSVRHEVAALSSVRVLSLPVDQLLAGSGCVLNGSCYITATLLLHPPAAAAPAPTPTRSSPVAPDVTTPSAASSSGGAAADAAVDALASGATTQPVCSSPSMAGWVRALRLDPAGSCVPAGGGGVCGAGSGNGGGGGGRGGGVGGVVRISESHVFLSEFKDMGLVNPGLKATGFALSDDRKRVSFKVSTRGAALFVQMESGLLGRFSDNGLVLAPCSSNTVTFIAKYPMTSTADFSASLTLHSLVE